MIKKHPRFHIFTNEKNERYEGVNKRIYKFKEEQDWDAICEATAKKRGVDPKELRAEWDEAANVSKARGIIYHEMMEDKYKNMNKPYIIFGNQSLSWKDCKLSDGHVYIEHPVWSDEHKIIGIVDYMQVKNGHLFVLDYKTNKEIKFEAFKDRTYFEPISHIPDCNGYDYFLQINFYAKLALINNPHLKLGKMVIEHVSFDWDNNVIGVEKIMVPDLQKEITLIL